MARKCPECGTPLDEIPFTDCTTHLHHERAAEAAWLREQEARPIWEKVREASSFEEIREDLARWLEAQANG